MDFFFSCAWTLVGVVCSVVRKCDVKCSVRFCCDEQHVQADSAQSKPTPAGDSFGSPPRMLSPLIAQLNPFAPSWADTGTDAVATEGTTTFGTVRASGSPPLGAEDAKAVLGNACIVLMGSRILCVTLKDGDSVGPGIAEAICVGSYDPLRFHVHSLGCICDVTCVRVHDPLRFHVHLLAAWYTCVTPCPPQLARDQMFFILVVVSTFDSFNTFREIKVVRIDRLRALS